MNKPGEFFIRGKRHICEYFSVALTGHLEILQRLVSGLLPRRLNPPDMVGIYPLRWHRQNERFRLGTRNSFLTAHLREGQRSEGMDSLRVHWMRIEGLSRGLFHTSENIGNIFRFVFVCPEWGQEGNITRTWWAEAGTLLDLPQRKTFPFPRINKG